MVINDGAHNYGLRVYYIKPTDQVKQLIDSNFREIKVFNRSGKEPDLSELEKDADRWLYYLCKK